jgi:hypothetical protein
MAQSPRARITDDFHADGHIPVRNGKGSRFHANPADRFESIHERSDVLRGDFSLQEFAFFAVLPPDDSGIELAEARFDFPDGGVFIPDLNRHINDRSLDGC